MSYILYTSPLTICTHHFFSPVPVLVVLLVAHPEALAVGGKDGHGRVHQAIERVRLLLGQEQCLGRVRKK